MKENDKEKIKHVHGRVPEKLYDKAVKKLDGKTWQSFILSQVKILVGDKKK